MHPYYMGILLKHRRVSFLVQLYREAGQRFIDPAADELVVWESLGDNSLQSDVDADCSKCFCWIR